MVNDYSLSAVQVSRSFLGHSMIVLPKMDAACQGYVAGRFTGLEYVGMDFLAAECT